jgi:chorismate mutase
VSSSREQVSEIVQQLLELPTERLSLDAVAEAIGASAVTFDDIEFVFEQLEAAGRQVESKPSSPPAALAKVLATARAFSTLSGRRPTLAEIAEHSGQSPAEVRFALLYARVLTR